MGKDDFPTEQGLTNLINDLTDDLRETGTNLKKHIKIMRRLNAARAALAELKKNKAR